MLEVEIPSGTLVKPHNHTREDECSLVLAGTVGVRIGDRGLEAGAGASLVKPRGTPHAMWNTNAATAPVLEMVAPAGLETYVEELAPILRHEGGAGRPEYDALAARYGIEILDDWVEELERTDGVKL